MDISWVSQRVSLQVLAVRPPCVLFRGKETATGNIFQKLEKVQGALEMCQKALNDFMET